MKHPVDLARLAGRFLYPMQFAVLGCNRYTAPHSRATNIDPIQMVTKQATGYKHDLRHPIVYGLSGPTKLRDDPLEEDE
jgi:hypothetical protein